MANLEETRIELSHKKIFFLSLLALAFVALGIWLLLVDQATLENTQRFSNPALVQLIGVAAVLFFGLCGAYAVSKLFEKTPGLIVNGEGFTDNSSGVAAGTIPWSEVTAVEQYQLQGQKFVSILVNDPYKYVNRGNFLKRMANKANLKMCGTPINISSNSLKMSHQELLELIERYFSNHRESSGLPLAE